MFRSRWAIPACFVPTIVLAVLTIARPGLSQQPPTSPNQTVTTEQRKQIEAAKSVTDLTTLAKQFLLTQKEAAARLCIERICALDPKLLTDAEPQTSSKPWNDFWFTCRAEIQAKKLSSQDAAGRLELARWLKQGGVYAPARALVTEALQIEPKLPEAKGLLVELEPPAQLDFRYALSRPVLLTEYTDQGVKVEGGRGNLLLLAPVRYRATEVRLSLIPGTIKVTTDVGKMARVLGLLLTEEPPKGDSRTTGGAGGAVVAPIQPTVPTPAATQNEVPDNFTSTFYERLQIELKGGTPTLIWQNTFTSRPTTPADRTTGGSRSTATPRGSTGGTSAREALADKRGEMPANGWLGLLIRFPEETKTLTIELPEAPPESIDLNLIKLAQQQQQASPGQAYTVKPEDQLKAIITFTNDPSAPTAQLALAWVGGNTSILTGPTGQAPTAGIDAVRALVAAGGHADRRVRRAGFEGLMQYPSPLPEEALDFLREQADEKTLAGMLDQVEAALAAGATKDPAAAMSVVPAATSSDPTLAKILETMPASQAPANAFVILGACINSRRDQARQEALRILLGDGSQQSLQILADLRKDAQKTLAGQFGKIKNPDMKAAVLRLLLINPDSATVNSCLAACGDLAVKVSADDDPLLTALQADNEKVNPKAKQALLLLLSRSDLSAIANSPKFMELLRSVKEENDKEPAVKSALLAMAASQLNLPYQAPFPRTTQAAAYAPEEQTGGFEKVLADVVMDPKVDQASAQKAAVILVASGRINALKDRFVDSRDVDRCAGIIRTLAKTKELWKRESLPVFLASALGNSSEDVRKEVLSALTILHDDCDKNIRWRINLAVRQGLDVNKVVELTFDPSKRVAEQATALIKRTIGMTSKEARDFDASSGTQARITCLTERILGERTKDPVGQYACLVLVDAEVTAQQPGGPAPTPAQTAPANRTNIPLTSARVTIKRGEQDALEILADSTQIGRLGGSGDAGGDPANPVQPGTLPVNPGELLAEALRSDDARKEGLAGKVSLRSIRDGVKQEKCELKPEPLGGWSAELTLSSQGPSDSPIRIVAAKIILQPLIP